PPGARAGRGEGVGEADGTDAGADDWTGLAARAGVAGREQAARASTNMSAACVRRSKSTPFGRRTAGPALGGVIVSQGRPGAGAPELPVSVNGTELGNGPEAEDGPAVDVLLRDLAPAPAVVAAVAVVAQHEVVAFPHLGRRVGVGVAEARGQVVLADHLPVHLEHPRPDLHQIARQAHDALDEGH